MYLNECLNYREGVGIFSDSSCRAVSSIIHVHIAKFTMFGNVNYNTFKKLVETGIIPIIEYCSGILGYKDFDCIVFTTG